MSWARTPGARAGLALGAILVASLATGCGGYLARNAAPYEADTSVLLDTRAAEVEACYAAELERNPKLVLGTLTVTFTVNKHTGKLSPASQDRNRTTVSETLATCVVTALVGLELGEADRRDGEATFRYSFRGLPGPSASPSGE